MNSRRFGGWRGWCLLMAALPATAHGASTPLIHHTFEDGIDGWAGVGPNSKAAVTRDASRVKEGKAALQYSYAVEKGEMGSLLLTANPSLAKARSFRFWVKSDAATTLAVVLQEKQGGRYGAAFAAPKDTWQQVEIALSDFALNAGKDDPKDPNNHLDLDQVEGVGITDLAQFFAQIEDAGIRELLGAQTGPRSLALDDFTISEGALPETAAAEGEVPLDRFERPQLQWIALGDLTLSRARIDSAGASRPEYGLKADYAQGPGKIAGLVRALPPGKLSGMERLLLDVAASRPTEIVVQVEETSGGKYNTRVSLPGDSRAQKLNLKLSEFTVGSDSNDNNTRLDLDQINQVLILDLSGFTGVEEGENTLRVSNLRAAPAKSGG